METEEQAREAHSKINYYKRISYELLRMPNSELNQKNTMMKHTRLCTLKIQLHAEE